MITARFDIDYQMRPITEEASHCPLIARKALTLTPGRVGIFSPLEGLALIIEMFLSQFDAERLHYMYALMNPRR